MATAIIRWMVAWSAISALVGIPILIGSALVIGAVYGCNIFNQNSHCVAQINQQGHPGWWMVLGPIGLAGLLGVGLVFRFRKEIAELGSAEDS
jgi:hypothetical protein